MVGLLARSRAFWLHLTIRGNLLCFGSANTPRYGKWLCVYLLCPQCRTMEKIRTSIVARHRCCRYQANRTYSEEEYVLFAVTAFFPLDSASDCRIAFFPCPDLLFRTLCAIMLLLAAPCTLRCADLLCLLYHLFPPYAFAILP